MSNSEQQGGSLPTGDSARAARRTDLRRNEQAFRLLVDSVQDYAIFMLDPAGRIVTWNRGAARIKGYTADEIIGQHFSKFYPPDVVARGWPQRELEIAADEGRISDEGWRVRKDGSIFWASVVITALRDEKGELYGFAKVTRDMTERRDWEEKIQRLNNELRTKLSQLMESQQLVELRTLELQNLSGRLLRIQDEERRRIARELHEEVGQQLTALKMMLEGWSTGAADPKRIPAALALSDETIQKVRQLSYVLHPPLLEEAGLVAALEWFIDAVIKRGGINVSLMIRPTEFPRLMAEVETTIFRVVQEALTNVYHHAGSSDARIELEQLPDSVTVRVRDFGKGVPAGFDRLPSGPGVGIRSMRERVHQLGGELRVVAAQPGTLVEANIPVTPLVSPMPEELSQVR